MPINKNPPYPQARQVDIFAPDIRADDNIVTPADFSQEQPDFIPANFKSLPPEEQERIKARMRFRGIRLRSDLENERIPLSRETLDIP